MKKRNLILPILVLFSMVFMLGFVSSALTINTPTLNQAVNGTFLFNATTSLGSAFNCTWSTTADGRFANTTSVIANQTEFNKSIDTSTLTDAHLTTLTVACFNTTATESATRVFTIDNTDPTCSFLISSTFVNRLSPIGILTTQKSTDTSTLTYLWNLTDETGVQQATSTDSDTTLSGDELEEIGINTLRLTVTDEVLKTATCTEEFLVKSQSDSADVVIKSQVEKQSRTNMLIWVLLSLGALTVIIGSVWILLVKSKKKR